MNGIAFASPWVLAAAAALAVPVLAHLARREDRQGRGFPSLMFLRRVPFPARARQHLTDRALLVLRALAILALVLAFAGPYPREDPSAVAPGARDTVVLLDVSFSMGSGDRFEDARALAATLEASGPGERVALVVFDDEARVVSPLDADPATVRAALVDAVPGHRATDFAIALRRAEQLLAASGAAARRVVLVSDLQETGLSAAAALHRDIDLVLRAVPAVTTGNLSVPEAVLEPAGDDGRRQLRVLVRNSLTELRVSSLGVRVNGLDAARETLALDPGGYREVRLAVFPAADTVTRVVVSLDDDALATDNRYHLTVEPPRQLAALLVTDGSGAPYVAATLTPDGDPAIRLRQLAPDAVEAASFEGVDLLILDAPLAPDLAVRDAVAERAARGMGVLAFASAAGGVPPSVPGIGAALRPALGTSLLPTSFAHPLAPVLGEGVVAVGPVWRHGVLDVLEGDTVLARLDDGSPAMVARTRGAARSLSVATAPGEAWSALGQRPEFAPWLKRSAAWLAGVVPPVSGYTPGSVLDVDAFAAATAGGVAFSSALSRGETLTVRRPSGRVERLTRGRPLVLDEPGFHELRAGTVGPLWVPVNVVTAESDLTRLTEQQFHAQIQRPAGTTDQTVSVRAPAPVDPGWGRLLAVLGAVLLLLEGLMAGWMARKPGREATA